MPTQKDKGGVAKLAFRFVLIIGIVNFFADMTYEGARANVGPFLGSLGQALRLSDSLPDSVSSSAIVSAPFRDISPTERTGTGYSPLLDTR